MSVVGMTYAQQSTALKPLRINFKNRGYFYASSAPHTAAAGLGGWAESGNMYTAVTDQNYSTGGLIVLLKPDESRTIAEKFEGFAVYIINQTDDTVFFDAQDSRINMKLQAKNKKGEWSDIEYLPSSWCGNSYHNVYLPANYQWSFTAPRYEGTLKTHIRAVLGYKKNLEAEEQWLYSNEIAGSVNPGQFNQTRKYEPAGIMDPYDN
jgi:hypothetical protein